MSDEIDVTYFKRRLLARQAELLGVKETGDENAKTVELDQSRVGRLSRMDALQGQAMSKAVNERRALEAKKITAALKRIDEGDYGYCLKCGDDIAVKRLEVDPAATLCIDCATESEKH